MLPAAGLALSVIARSIDLVSGFEGTAGLRLAVAEVASEAFVNGLLSRHLPQARPTTVCSCTSRPIVRSSPPLGGNVASKVVENGLPPVTLLLDRMSLLTIEGDPDFDAIRGRSKLDLGGAIAEGVFNQLVLDELRIGAGEIKAHAAIFCLHARGECAAHAQVDCGSGRVPVIGGGIPLFNVLGCRIGAPNLLDGCSDGCFNSNRHRRPLR